MKIFYAIYFHKKYKIHHLTMWQKEYIEREPDFYLKYNYCFYDANVVE